MLETGIMSHYRKDVHRTVHLTEIEDALVREIAKRAGISVNRAIECAIVNPLEYAKHVDVVRKAGKLTAIKLFKTEERK